LCRVGVVNTAWSSEAPENLKQESLWVQMGEGLLGVSQRAQDQCFGGLWLGHLRQQGAGTTGERGLYGLELGRILQVGVLALTYQRSGSH
jgi:hypothetical protein